MSLLLAAFKAQAGTYMWTKKDAAGNILTQSPTYSGGKWVSDGSGAAFPRSFNQKLAVSGGSYTGGGTNSWTKPGVPSPNETSGDIKVTFTWQPSGPGDDPPGSVIVQETGQALWSGNGTALPTGHCTDGLTDPEVDVTAPPPAPVPGITGTSKGTHWSVKVNPGQSFSLTRTLDASLSATASAGPPATSGSGSTSSLMATWQCLRQPVWSGRLWTRQALPGLM